MADHPDRLPLLCRLRRHDWQPSPTVPGGYDRTTCHRCRHLDLPSPAD